MSLSLSLSLSLSYILILSLLFDRVHLYINFLFRVFISLCFLTFFLCIFRFLLPFCASIFALSPLCLNPLSFWKLLLFRFWRCSFLLTSIFELESLMSAPTSYFVLYYYCYCLFPFSILFLLFLNLDFRFFERDGFLLL